jgi:hypothetical protein
MRSKVYVFIAACAALLTPTWASATDTVPAFMHAEIGKTAYIDDDADPGAYVCRGATYIFNLLLDIKTCATFPHGTLIRMTDLVKATGSDSRQHLAVRSDAVNTRSRSGWVDIIQLQPIIPLGTMLRIHDIVQLTTNDKMPTSLSATPTDGIFEVTDNTLARLVKQTPPIHDAANCQVEIVGGRLSGKRGWLVGMGVEIDGTHLDPLHFAEFNGNSL